MRLLSFLNLLQNHLGVRQPEHASGWTRRVNYHAGSACFMHPTLGLTLTLRDCVLADGQHNLSATWHGLTGEAVSNRSFFSGLAGFQWEAAAEAVLEIMPAPALPAETAEEPAAPQRLSA